MITDRTDSPLRVVTIGEESVGKTSITKCFIDNAFNPFEPGTIGANYQQYSHTVNGETIDVQIWDTAGQEKFKSLAPIYFRNAAAAVVVFSLTSKSSFNKLQDWINSFTEIVGSSALIVLAANKSDLLGEIEVEMSEAKEWAESRNYPLYVTSAKTGEGVRDLFIDLAEKLLDVKESHVNLISQAKKSSGCCS
ncbi:small GTP-binding protein [Tritrichomonas foetus]|uniref:Small GTP-binding protein n=1 Tax=Tritrichomonas foetus TaxID=1144522 RepID=A0A1J4JLS6_9EUKA|nr:small GTP-binding protein [Tritrichomonas foetus]|eukprot:OHT00055.1 small GTP-binding protein [Tritrichomonas foetus]